MTQTLAQLVKAKHPEYAEVPDVELEQRIRSKFPGAYDNVPSTQDAPVAAQEPAGATNAPPQGFLSALAENAIPEAIRNPSMIAQAPGALADVVRAQIESGDPSAFVAPGAGPVLAQMGKDIAGSSAQAYQHQREMGASVPVAALAATPVIGPPAAQAGEEIGRGDYAAGLGHAAGMLAPFAVKPALSLAGKIPTPTAGQVVEAARFVKSPVRSTFRVIGRSAASGLAEGVSEGLSKSMRARLEHVLTREAPAVVKDIAESAKIEPAAPAGSPKPTITEAAGRAARPRSVTQELGQAPEMVKPEASAVAVPEGVKVNPATTAPGGWKEVGIANWYGTEGAPTAAEWAKMGGTKMQRAWLESRNFVPGGNTAQDVATAVAKGVPPEQVMKLYGKARMPAMAEKAVEGPKAVKSPTSTKVAAKDINAASEQIASKVTSLKAKGLSNAQIADSVRELFGVPLSTAKKMTTMVLSGPR